jgi:hypothetical protein
MRRLERLSFQVTIKSPKHFQRQADCFSEWRGSIFERDPSNQATPALAVACFARSGVKPDRAIHICNEFDNVAKFGCHVVSTKIRQLRLQLSFDF